MQSLHTIPRRGVRKLLFCTAQRNKMGEILLSAEFDWQREFVYFGNPADNTKICTVALNI
jgi:hypothetical protein